MSTRATMAAELILSSSAPTKTFVLEAHTDEPDAYLLDLAGKGRVEPTDDAYLYKVHTDHGRFWVDQLNSRFWSFHTDMGSEKAASIVNGWAASRHDLDWMWLPSEHLRDMWPGARAHRFRSDFRGGALLGVDGAAIEDLRVQFSGRNADAFLDVVSKSGESRSAVAFDSVETHFSDPDFGSLREAVNRKGKFAASGDSLELHLQFVGAVVERYSRFVTMCESKSIAWTSLASGDEDDGGGSFTGGPIVVLFSRSIPNQQLFLEELFSSRAPFRLWGVPEISSDGVAEVEAVDLHVGQRLRVDVGDRWLRIYLEAGGCGNTVARLVSNLQHRFDGALSLLDPELSSAVGQHLSPNAA